MLLLMSTWVTRHHSFPLEEHNSNPNERDHVKVMGYFNLSGEARGWIGLGCFTKFLHQANVAYPQKNYVSFAYITTLYSECTIVVFKFFYPWWRFWDQRGKNIETKYGCRFGDDSVRAHRNLGSRSLSNSPREWKHYMFTDFSIFLYWVFLLLTQLSVCMKSTG